MACYHPLKALQYGAGSGSRLKFCTTSDELKRWSECDVSGTEFPRALKIPCKQCIGCRMIYSRNWAIRCMLESTLHEKNSCWFLTLTYDDDHLPVGFACNSDTGEVTYETHPIVYKDFQDFLKRLRINAKRDLGIDNIRFFGCGEYGTLSKRPHFHAIIFGLPERLIKPFPYRHLKGGQLLFECHLINKSWDKGFAPFGLLTFDSAAYTAGYIMKKQKGKEALNYYLSHGLTPEESRMSRRPGIAHDYFDMYSDEILNNDKIPKFFPGLNCCPPPVPYFDNLLKDLYGEDNPTFIKNKAIRKLRSEESLKFLLEEIGLTEDEYLEKQEFLIKDSCKNRSKKC